MDAICAPHKGAKKFVVIGLCNAFALNWLINTDG